MKTCYWCGANECNIAIDGHHVYRRGSHPNLAEEPRNIMLLCRTCHMRTENDNEFYERLQGIWCANTAWKPEL